MADKPVPNYKEVPFIHLVPCACPPFFLFNLFFIQALILCLFRSMVWTFWWEVEGEFIQRPGLYLFRSAFFGVLLNYRIYLGLIASLGLTTREGIC